MSADNTWNLLGSASGILATTLLGNGGPAPSLSVRDGICVDPPLCRGTSQGKFSSCTEGLVCVGEIVGKIGEVVERGHVLVASVRCGKE